MDLLWWHQHPHCMGVQPVPSSPAALSCLPQEPCPSGCWPHPAPMRSIAVPTAVLLCLAPHCGCQSWGCQCWGTSGVTAAFTGCAYSGCRGSSGWCLGVSPAKFKGLCGINILGHK